MNRSAHSAVFPDSDKTPERSEAAVQWGWALFGSGGMLGTIALLFLYDSVWVNDSRAFYFGEGLFSVLVWVISAVGFIQMVTGVPLFRLHKVWRSLASWRRGLILVFLMISVDFFATAACFLLTLSSQLTINTELYMP